MHFAPWLHFTRIHMSMYPLSSITLFEPVHEIFNNVVCATSKASDQPAHTRSLIRAFASRLSILWSFGVFKLKRRLQKLVWVYTCQNATLLEISCTGSFPNRRMSVELKPSVRFCVCVCYEGSKCFRKTSQLILQETCRPSDLWWARVIVPWFQNMAHHFPRQWAQWTYPF